MLLLCKPKELTLPHAVVNFGEKEVMPDLFYVGTLKGKNDYQLAV